MIKTIFIKIFKNIKVFKIIDKKSKITEIIFKYLYLILN